MGNLYGNMGVDAHKGSVEAAFSGKIDNHFEGAFVNITHDRLAPGYVRTMKVDGDGSRPTQHVLHYLETQDETSFDPTADDTHAMVTVDAAAAGFVDEYIFEDVIDLNKFTYPGIKELIFGRYSQRIQQIIELHRQYGIDEEFLGGETADLPSQTPSYICNGILYARTHRERVIRGNIADGDTIWGFSSAGQAIWENLPNPGLMTNGLTLGCASLMWEGYNQKYPFLRHPNQKYFGRFRVHDQPVGLDGLTASEALRTPCRQLAILFRLLYIELLNRDVLHMLHGATANTGGGASKCLRLGKNIRYEKQMIAPPPIFQLIQQESGVSWEEMFMDFNCGIAIDLIGSDECGYLEAAFRAVSAYTGIPYYKLGVCRRSSRPCNEVVLTTNYGTFTYP